jgi:hypothetical protein
MFFVERDYCTHQQQSLWLSGKEKSNEICSCTLLGGTSSVLFGFDEDAGPQTLPDAGETLNFLRT